MTTNMTQVKKAILKEYLTVRISNQLFGLPVTEIQEIIGHQSITHIPLAPSQVAGSLNLRGRIVTAIDVRVLIGHEPDGGDRKTTSVVVERHLTQYPFRLPVLALDEQEFAADRDGLPIVRAQLESFPALVARFLVPAERVERTGDGDADLAVARVERVRPAVLHERVAEGAADLHETPQAVVKVRLGVGTDLTAASGATGGCSACAKQDHGAEKRHRGLVDSFHLRQSEQRILLANRTQSSTPQSLSQGRGAAFAPSPLREGRA